MKALVVALSFVLPASALAQNVERVLPGPEQVRAGELPFSEPLGPVPVDDAWTYSLLTSVGLADAFHSKFVFSLGVRRSFGRLSLGGFAARAVTWTNPAMELCSAPGVCSTPGSTLLGATPGRLDWLAGLGIGLRAAQGKLSVAGLGLPEFRLDASADASLVGYQLDDAPDSSRWAPGLRLGLTASAQFAHGWRLGVDLASLLYVPRIRGEWGVERQILLGLLVAFSPGGER